MWGYKKENHRFSQDSYPQLLKRKALSRHQNLSAFSMVSQKALYCIVGCSREVQH